MDLIGKEFFAGAVARSTVGPGASVTRLVFSSKAGWPARVQAASAWALRHARRTSRSALREVEQVQDLVAKQAKTRVGRTSSASDFPPKSPALIKWYVSAAWTLEKDGSQEAARRLPQVVKCRPVGSSAVG